MKMSSKILDNIESLPQDGVSLRYNCPECGEYNTLSITNTDGVLKAYCFENSCNVSFIVSHTRSINDIKQCLKERKDTKITWEIPEYWVKGIANDEMYQYLDKNNCLKALHAGYFKVAYDPKEHRCCFLLPNGAVCRTLHKDSPLKSKNFGDVTEPFIVGGGSTLVVVEDCASAATVGAINGYSGMAMNGTNFKQEYYRYLSKYDRIIVACDKDATKTSLKIKKSLQFWHNYVRILFLDKDFKNMSWKEVEDKLNG